jgi:hypothetical protein
MTYRKTLLTGGPEKTATWIWLEHGLLKVEFYDFSELAQQMFGNDIAYTLTVDGMKRLFSIAEQEESSLVEWMAEKFRSYFDIKRWLEEHGIDFSLERESWA